MFFLEIKSIVYIKTENDSKKHIFRKNGQCLKNNIIFLAKC